MNASTIGNAKPAARAKQEEYAAKLRALADRIRVDDSDTEVSATKSIQQDDIDLAKSNVTTAPATAEMSGQLL